MGAPEVKSTVKQKIRDRFTGHVILSGGYDAARAESDLTEKKGDLIAFGRPFISNPGLVAKLQDGVALEFTGVYSRKKQIIPRLAEIRVFNN